MKRKKKKRRKVNKAKVALSVFVGVIVVLIVASFLSQPHSPQGEPEPANKYFQVLGSTVDDGDFPNFPDTTELIILGLSLNLTAVGGDAHDVFLESTGFSDPQYIGNMPKDQIRFVSLQFPQGYLSVKKESGFPVSIRIRSTEAVGEITFYIPYE